MGTITTVSENKMSLKILNLAFDLLLFAKKIL